MVEEKEDVFFIGAGFSKEYEIPLVKEWFEHISQVDKTFAQFLTKYSWLKDEEKWNIYNDNSLQNDIRSISNLLAGVDASIKEDVCKAIIYLNNQKDKKYRNAILNLINWIIYLNYLRLFRSNKEYKYYKKILGEKNVVITLNYDNIIEREHPENNAEKNNSFIIDGKYFGFSNSGEIGRPTILKMHGGHAYVNKNRNEQEQKFLFIYTNSRKEFIGYEKWKETHGDYGQDTNFNYNEASYEQIIIPPLDAESKSKLIDSFRIYFEQTKKIAEEELKKAKRIFIIGYSFNELDNDINDILKNCSINGSEKELYVVGRGDPDTVRLLRIFPLGCKYLKMTAGDFAAYYPDNLDKCFERCILIKCPNH